MLFFYLFLSKKWVSRIFGDFGWSYICHTFLVFPQTVRFLASFLALQVLSSLGDLKRLPPQSYCSLVISGGIVTHVGWWGIIIFMCWLDFVIGVSQGHWLHGVFAHSAAITWFIYFIMIMVCFNIFKIWCYFLFPFPMLDSGLFFSLGCQSPHCSMIGYLAIVGRWYSKSERYYLHS